MIISRTLFTNKVKHTSYSVLITPNLIRLDITNTNDISTSEYYFSEVCLAWILLPFAFLVSMHLLTGLENREYGHRDPSRWPSDTLYLQMLVLASPTSGSGSVGIVRSRTEATEREREMHLLITLLRLDPWIWSHLLLYYSYSCRFNL
jgi:hypothetical protein